MRRAGVVIALSFEEPGVDVVMESDQTELADRLTEEISARVSAQDGSGDVGGAVVAIPDRRLYG
jgi:hypothetical protein